MASHGISISLVMVLLAMFCGAAMTQSPSCTNAMSYLAPCLTYITGNSSTPSSSCCSQLGNVVQSSPQCLCSLLNGNVPAVGLTINQTLALSLPVACKVQAPPINQCKAATAPTPSAFSPVSSQASSPSSSTASSPSSSTASSPSSSTASSPSDSSNETPEPAITPSASTVPSAAGTGSKTVPSTTGTSDGNLVKAPIHLVLFVLFVASCGSTVFRF